MVLPTFNAEAIGEADKMTVWDTTTLKINDRRSRLLLYDQVLSSCCWSYDFFLQIGYGVLIVEYYAIQGVHDPSDGFIQTRAH